MKLPRFMHKHIDSKLSKGPKNCKHKIFLKNQRAIHKVLNQALAHRRLNLKLQEVCKLANITLPTFYSHCRDTNEALHNYEVNLKQEFANSLPTHFSREAYFTVLLAFVCQHRD